MARRIDMQDIERAIFYTQQKIRHGVDEFEFESADKTCVLVISCKAFLTKLERMDVAQANKWFRVKENGVHVRVMDFEKGAIDTKRFCAGGRVERRPARIGNWAAGEKQKAAEANEGIHNGNRGGHWFDYSYINELGVRVHVEVKHIDAWFEPNREGH